MSFLIFSLLTTLSLGSVVAAQNNFIPEQGNYHPHQRLNELLRSKQEIVKMIKKEKQKWKEEREQKAQKVLEKNKRVVEMVRSQTAQIKLKKEKVLSTNQEKANETRRWKEEGKRNRDELIHKESYRKTKIISEIEKIKFKAIKKMEEVKELNRSTVRDLKAKNKAMQEEGKQKAEQELYRKQQTVETARVQTKKNFNTEHSFENFNISEQKKLFPEDLGERLQKDDWLEKKVSECVQQEKPTEAQINEAYQFLISPNLSINDEEAVREKLNILPVEKDGELLLNIPQDSFLFGKTSYFMKAMEYLNDEKLKDLYGKLKGFSTFGDMELITISLKLAVWGHDKASDNLLLRVMTQSNIANFTLETWEKYAFLEKSSQKQPLKEKAIEILKEWKKKFGNSKNPYSQFEIN